MFQRPTKFWKLRASDLDAFQSAVGYIDGIIGLKVDVNGRPKLGTRPHSLNVVFWVRINASFARVRRTPADLYFIPESQAFPGALGCSLGS